MLLNASLSQSKGGLGQHAPVVQDRAVCPVVSPVGEGVLRSPKRGPCNGTHLASHLAGRQALQDLCNGARRVVQPIPICPALRTLEHVHGSAIDSVSLLPLPRLLN